MKIISVESAESVKRWIEEHPYPHCAGTYRPEHIRLAIREQIRNEILSSDRPIHSEPFHFEPQESNTIRFYQRCIKCGAILDLSARNNHFFYKNIEVFRLQFCCSCYKQFKDKSFDEFPPHILEKIQREIRAYKE